MKQTDADKFSRVSCPNHPESETKYRLGCSSDEENSMVCGRAACTSIESLGGIWITVHGQDAVWKIFCIKHRNDEARAEADYKLGL